MTEFLFQIDSYIKEFESEIIEISENALVLDKTAFSYQGGGLQSDTGIIQTKSGEKYEVKHVIFRKGKVFHSIIPNPSEDLVGKTVKCSINWEPRYRQMRMHTTLHAISAILYKKYGSTVTGGNIDPEKSRVDFEIDHLRQERVQEIAEAIELIVSGSHDVSISFLEREEALKDPDLIRTKVNLIPESVKTIRIVEIEDGIDKQADGGVHVANTKEIGEFIPLKSENRGKNNKRLYFTVK
ncbi:MAG: alanyl-tRNA editing protein [Asgard group archaeon]|nr:alanyl-tRNA editing protein [Asgard group archaeon]